MTATKAVLRKVALGTEVRGFSTASAFTDADSKPRKDHKVKAMELPTASLQLMGLGHQASIHVVGLNQYQPMTQIVRIGRMEHQIVKVVSLLV